MKKINEKKLQIVFRLFQVSLVTSMQKVMTDEFQIMERNDLELNLQIRTCSCEFTFLKNDLFIKVTLDPVD